MCENNNQNNKISWYNIYAIFLSNRCTLKIFTNTACYDDIISAIEKTNGQNNLVFVKCVDYFLRASENTRGTLRPYFVSEFYEVILSQLLKVCYNRIKIKKKLGRRPRSTY